MRNLFRFVRNALRWRKAHIEDDLRRQIVSNIEMLLDRRSKGFRTLHIPPDKDDEVISQIG